MKMTHLEALLGRAGLSKQEFAEKYKVVPTTVSRWNRRLPWAIESWLGMYIELEELKGEKESFFEVFQIVDENGNLRSFPPCFGLINNSDGEEVCAIIYDRDSESYFESLESYLDEEDIKIKPDHEYKFKITNWSHNEGQMSFPETGQWDFPPHWQYDIEIISKRELK